MKHPVSADLINKYLTGTCTIEEEVSIRQWYASFDNDDDYVSALSQWQKQELKNKVRNGISVRLASTDYGNAVVKKSPVLRFRVLSAASIATLFLVFVFIKIIYRPEIKPDSSNFSSKITFQNNTHTILERMLSDGSRIWLSPGSQISYSKTFSGSEREVSLIGESFFDVTKNPQKPFIIHGKNILVKVWGTSFRVRDSRDFSFADVAVVTGKVSVKLTDPTSYSKFKELGKTSEVMIYPNQQVRYEKGVRALKIYTRHDVTELHIWKKTNISFDNQTMKEIIPVLNKAFDVNITVADSKINSYMLSADFDGLNFPEVLEILKKSLNINYDLSAGKVIFKTN